MTAVIVILSVIVALTALALLRICAELSFIQEKLSLFLRIGFLKLRLLPKKPSLKAPKKKSEKPKKAGKKPKTAKEKKESKRKTDIIGLIRDGLHLLAGIRRRILIKYLRVTYIIPGGDDASKAAITNGGLAGILGVSSGIIEKTLRIRSYNLRTNVDFLSTKPEITAEVSVSIAVWEIIAIGIGALRIFLRNRKKPNE